MFVTTVHPHHLTFFRKGLRLNPLFLTIFENSGLDLTLTINSLPIDFLSLHYSDIALLLLFLPVFYAIWKFAIACDFDGHNNTWYDSAASDYPNFIRNPTRRITALDQLAGPHHLILCNRLVMFTHILRNTNRQYIFDLTKCIGVYGLG